MWGLFFAAAFAGAVFLFVPGALVLAGLRMHVASAVAFAPLLGIPATIALCLAYAALGINTNWATVFFPRGGSYHLHRRSCARTRSASPSLR